MSWPVVSLAEVCEINVGRTPSRNEPAYWDDGVHPWASIADLGKQRELQDTKERFSEKARVECNMRPVPVGTVLLSFKLSIGKVGIAARQLFTNEAIAALPVKNENNLYAPFLARTLEAIDFSNSGSHAVMGRTFNKKSLADIKIPLPPLPEQKRIAGILDQADALRRLRARALEKLSTLGQAIFQEMFGEPMEEWPEVSISHITRDARTGPFGSQLLVSEFTDTGIPVLGIDNVVQNKFAWAKERYITKHKYEQLKRYQVKPGDILVTIMGTCGRCAVVPEGIGRAINTKHICCLTPIDTLVRSIFLQSALIWDRSILLQLGVESKGAIMPGLNMGKIVNLKIRLPPIGKQELFAERIRLISEQTQKLEHSQVGASSLFTSLQHRAFRGEL